MKHPDPKKHQLISFAKSAIRIIGGIVAAVAATNQYAPYAVIVLAVSFVLAELVGVYEELV